MVKRRVFTPDFKAQIVLEELSALKTELLSAGSTS